MHDDHDAADIIGNALPQHQPPARFDLDQIVRDGYRVRRRNRIVAGGSATMGVIAAVGAIAMLVSFQPGGPPPTADEPTPEVTGPAEEAEPIDDLSMAGYPYNHGWGRSPGTGAEAELSSSHGPDPIDISSNDADQLNAAALPALSALMDQAGQSDSYVADIEQYNRCFTNGQPTNDSEGCPYGRFGLIFSPQQIPGNYGQVFLRRYHGSLWSDSQSVNPSVEVEYYLPGGWTPEPGPISDQVFPRHLWSESAHYTDMPPAWEEYDLPDGRQAFVTDHGCAYEALVIYPNDSAFRIAWDTGCDGSFQNDVALDDLIEAALAMPQFSFDTSALRPIDELWDIPPAWPWDAAWELDEGLERALQGVDGFGTALEAHFPGSTIDPIGATQLGIQHRGSSHIRAYRYDGLLAATGANGDGGSSYFEFRYFIPGGWLPGISNENLHMPYLAYCREEAGAVCREFERDGWIATTEVVDGLEYEVSVAHPDGWGAAIWIGLEEGGIDATIDDVVDMMLDLPAPPYDPTETPAIPNE